MLGLAQRIFKEFIPKLEPGFQRVHCPRGGSKAMVQAMSSLPSLKIDHSNTPVPSKIFPYLQRNQIHLWLISCTAAAGTSCVIFLPMETSR